jgi:predicted O-methyltransferase YrrM
MPTMTYVGGRATGSPYILIAVPTYSGQVGAQFLASIVESISLLDAAGVRTDFCIESGNCHVDDARNSVVRQFLKTECTDLVFIDSDVGWRSEDLVKLVKYDADIVAGVYPKKQDDVDFPVFMEAGKEIWAREDGLVEVVGAPTGFMRIRRSVIEKLVETHRARGFKGQGDPDGELYYPIFERLIEAGRRWSGDYAFCRKWRGLGGKIFVAPEMEFTHEGNKVWAGCLGDHWRNIAGLFHPVIGQSIKKIRAGDDAGAINDLVRAWGNPYSATSELCFTAYRMAKNAGTVLETGSGVTTILMALAGAKVYSLEHDLYYLERTKKALEQFGIENVELIYAPLKEYGGFTWYSLPETLTAKFDLVLCDGPQRRYGRDGLFHLLGEQIKGAPLIVDDANDQNVINAIKKYAPEREIEILGELRKFAIAVEKRDG